VEDTFSYHGAGGHRLGDRVFGGIVIGSINDGKELFIVTESELINGAKYGTRSNWDINAVGDGTLASSLTDGQHNTQQVLTNGGFSEVDSIFTRLGSYCYNDYGGYTDWHIPSIEELKIVCKAYHDGLIQAENTLYWSSTEANGRQAYDLLFTTGHQNVREKRDSANRLRVVRRHSLV